MIESDLDSLLDEEITTPSHNISKESTQSESSNGYNKPEKQYSNYNGNKKDENKINMYDVDVVKAKDIDTDTFEKSGRSFMVHAYNAPEEIVEKILKVSAKLIKDGFVYRHDGASDDEVQNKILSLCTEAGQSESYIPFKKFNENVKTFISPNQYELPYRYACQIFGPSFNDKLGKGAKACYASKLQAMLGKDSTNPIDFLLCYNVNGDEAYPPYKKGGPKLDYSKLGTLGFYLKVTDKINLPVYNFKKPESIKTLVELIR